LLPDQMGSLYIEGLILECVTSASHMCEHCSWPLFAVP
jgi:hypothetical protein